MPQSALQDRVAQALSPLIGLPLWGAARALDLEMFAFGKRYPEKNRKGEDVEVGEFSWHITCAWRIVGPTGIVVGALDRHYPEEENSDWTAFDRDGPTRCEAQIAAWLSEHAAAPLKAQSVEADRFGG